AAKASSPAHIAGVMSALCLSMLCRTDATFFEPLHCLIRELCERTVATNNEHQDRFSFGPPLLTFSKRRSVLGRQGASHWNESLVRVMIAHLQSMRGLRLAVIEFESSATSCAACPHPGTSLHRHNLPAVADHVEHVRSHRSVLLSGKPLSKSLMFLKRATRFIISSRER